MAEISTTKFADSMSINRIEKLKTFLQDNPKDCFLHHALGLEYVKSGDYANAQQHFEANLQNDANYVATYYHLGKLLEALQKKEEAIRIYEQGMEISKKLNDNHSYSELQSVYEDLVY